MSFVADKIKSQHIGKPHERGEWRQAEVYQHSSKPSWKRYGDGVSSAKVSAVIGPDGPILEIGVSETALAGLTGKRDVTKDVHFTAYGPGALAIYQALKEAFEPVNGL